MDIVEYEPTAIVKIMIDDLTVPMETGIELTKLALVIKEVVMEYIKDGKRDKETKEFSMPPAALPWVRELRLIEKDIHDLTKGVQEKALMGKMDITKTIFKELAKKMTNEELVNFIKTIQNSEKQSDKRRIIEQSES